MDGATYSRRAGAVAGRVKSAPTTRVSESIERQGHPTRGAEQGSSGGHSEAMDSSVGEDGFTQPSTMPASSEITFRR
jgi:hypothetical protein